MAILCLACIFAAPLIAIGQEPPSSVTFIPEEPEVNDTIDFVLTSGTLDTPWENISGMVVTFQIEGASLKGIHNPQHFLSAYSWLLDNVEHSVGITVDTQTQRVTVTIDLAEGNARSGYGYVLSGGGLIIVVDEIGKRPLIQLVSIELQALGKSKEILSYTITPQEILVEIYSAVAGLKLMDINGTTIFQTTCPKGSHRIPLRLSSGCYILQIQSEEGHLLKKYCLTH